MCNDKFMSHCNYSITTWLKLFSLSSSRYRGIVWPFFICFINFNIQIIEKSRI